MGRPLQFGRAKFDRSVMLRLRRDFDDMRAAGVKYVGRSMLLVAASSSDGQPRFGVICGKKFSRKAVERNRARRLLKESYRLVSSRVSPARCLFIARFAMRGAGLSEVQAEMIRLFRRAGLWLEDGD
jgi:ribonuclease P protein component